jgi:hypothetical protein
MAGAESISYSADRISYFQNRGWRYSLMGVFGMGTLKNAECQPQIENFGPKRSLAT